ncbi:hypothetical protein PFISCL1PPCAC_29111, partial [Pristionchus fissidentatus]
SGRSEGRDAASLDRLQSIFVSEQQQFRVVVLRLTEETLHLSRRALDLESIGQLHNSLEALLCDIGPVRVDLTKEIDKLL